MIVWRCLRSLLTKLHIFDPFVFFTRGLLVMPWRLFSEIVENRRKSSKLAKNRKIEVQKIEFSTSRSFFLRSKVTFLDSGEKIGPIGPIKKKSRFSGKKNASGLQNVHIFSKISDFQILRFQKIRILALKIQVLPRFSFPAPFWNQVGISSSRIQFWVEKNFFAFFRATKRFFTNGSKFLDTS